MEAENSTEPFLSNLCIELSSACNLHCYMCAHHNEPSVHGELSQNGFMSMQVWDNIIKGFAEREKLIESITLYWLGESRQSSQRLLWRPSCWPRCQHTSQSLGLRADVRRKRHCSNQHAFGNRVSGEWPGTCTVLNYLATSWSEGVKGGKHVSRHPSSSKKN